jgi:hypothetical protein
MYRIFCESYENYIKQYDSICSKEDYRYKISNPFELISNIKRFRMEQSQETLLYKHLCDLLYYMAENLDRYPKMRAFLWTLEARDIKGQRYDIVPAADLEEQTKLANMFLNLLYWDETEEAGTH